MCTIKSKDGRKKKINNTENKNRMEKKLFVYISQSLNVRSDIAVCMGDNMVQTICDFDVSVSVMCMHWILRSQATMLNPKGKSKKRKTEINK